VSGRVLRRAFLAVEPPPDVLDAIGSLVESLDTSGGRLRWTTRAQWHVTLGFLGPVADVEDLERAVSDAVRGAPSASVRLGGGGAFPRPARASVLWLGCTDGADALGTVAGVVTRATEALGYEAEAREFRPHVTLARARDRRDVRPLLEALGSDPVGPAWTLDEVVLFESETHSEGARYTAVSRMPVGRSSPS
jgi:2'-5' RNA ligase